MSNVRDPNDVDRLESQADNGGESGQETSKLRKAIYNGIIILINLVVLGYFVYATYHYIDVENNYCSGPNPHPLCDIQFCTGYGCLLLLLFFIYLGLVYFLVFKPSVGNHIYKNCLHPFGEWWRKFSHTTIVSAIMLAILFIALAVFLFFETKDEPSKLQSLVAPFFLILTGYVFSYQRSAIQWRTVINGILIQFILGVICIKWAPGRRVFECLGKKAATFLAFTNDGSRMVFGNKIIDDGVFAFTVLPVVFFFSFFISILHYLGALQWSLLKLGWILQQMLGTTVCESVTAAANIFLGMSESAMMIRPYLPLLTASEMHSIMVSGFATVSGSTLAAYLSFGASASYLITASVMAAPAALAFAKLYMPETEESKTTSDNMEFEQSEDSSFLDAAANGARSAIPIVLGIVANIIAFIAFITFLNAVVSWLGFLVGIDNASFELIFTKLFVPLAWAMGVPNKDINTVAEIIAIKSITNEFVAYSRLGQYIKGGKLDDRSAAIATFAICGFANPGSLGILIGALSAMAPDRREIITFVAFRAVVVGSIVSFVSASFAAAGAIKVFDKVVKWLEKPPTSFNTSLL